MGPVHKRKIIAAKKKPAATNNFSLANIDLTASQAGTSYTMFPLNHSNPSTSKPNNHRFQRRDHGGAVPPVHYNSPAGLSGVTATPDSLKFGEIGVFGETRRLVSARIEIPFEKLFVFLEALTCIVNAIVENRDLDGIPDVLLAEIPREGKKIILKAVCDKGSAGLVVEWTPEYDLGFQKRYAMDPTIWKGEKDSQKNGLVLSHSPQFEEHLEFLKFANSIAQVVPGILSFYPAAHVDAFKNFLIAVERQGSTGKNEADTYLSILDTFSCSHKRHETVESVAEKLSSIYHLKNATGLRELLQDREAIKRMRHIMVAYHLEQSTKQIIEFLEKKDREIADEEPPTPEEQENVDNAKEVAQVVDRKPGEEIYDEETDDDGLTEDEEEDRRMIEAAVEAASQRQERAERQAAAESQRVGIKRRALPDVVPGNGGEAVRVEWIEQPEALPPASPATDSPRSPPH